MVQEEWCQTGLLSIIIIKFTPSSNHQLEMGYRPPLPFDDGGLVTCVMWVWCIGYGKRVPLGVWGTSALPRSHKVHAIILYSAVKFADTLSLQFNSYWQAVYCAGSHRGEKCLFVRWYGIFRHSSSQWDWSRLFKASYQLRARHKWSTVA